VNAAHDLYLDLMMRCLTDWIYDGFDERARAEGRDWPARAHTMIGLKRLANLRTCVETILDDGVPGDLIETGVWRGGATIFMRAILQARGVGFRSRRWPTGYPCWPAIGVRCPRHWEMPGLCSRSPNGARRPAAWCRPRTRSRPGWPSSSGYGMTPNSRPNIVGEHWPKPTAGMETGWPTSTKSFLCPSPLADRLGSTVNHYTLRCAVHRIRHTACAYYLGIVPNREVIPGPFLSLTCGELRARAGLWVSFRTRTV
jgi:hypothetical protein